MSTTGAHFHAGIVARRAERARQQAARQAGDTAKPGGAGRDPSEVG
jgi:hypothetical protein